MHINEFIGGFILWHIEDIEDGVDLCERKTQLRIHWRGAFDKKAIGYVASDLQHDFPSLDGGLIMIQQHLIAHSFGINFIEERMRNQTTYLRVNFK